MPSWLSALVSPTSARWLNERSLRPPMSVTSPTLIFFPPPPWAEVEVPDGVDVALDVVSSPPPPQPAATTASPAARPAAAIHGIHRLRVMHPPVAGTSFRRS